MSHTAQKEDLSDASVIGDFAAKVGNPRRLTALYLLTVADIRGTSPKVWNAWKGKLLEDLYRLTMRKLGGDVLAHRRRDRGAQEGGAPDPRAALRPARHRDAAVEDAGPELLRAPRPERAGLARALAVAPHRDRDPRRARAPVAARRRPAGAAVLARPLRPVRAHLRLLRRRRLLHPGRQDPHDQRRLRARHLPGRQPGLRGRRPGRLPRPDLAGRAPGRAGRRRPPARCRRRAPAACRAA